MIETNSVRAVDEGGCRTSAGAPAREGDAASERTVLVITGSSRDKSLNRQMAERAADMLRPRAHVRFLDYADVPFFNQDDEFPPPASVLRVRDEAASADGIWIVTPEYNHGVPGTLKNLLDWLSRPAVLGEPSVMAGKPVVYSGVSGSSQARYVFAALLASLECMKMDVVEVEPTGVSLDRRAYETSELSLSDDALASLELQAMRLLERIG